MDRIAADNRAGPAERWGVLVALLLARLAFGFQFQTVASEAALLLPAFGLDYTGLGALVGAYMAPGVLVALPGGMLGRRFGGRVVVGAGLFLMAAGGLVCAAATETAVMAAGRALSGAGAVTLVVMQGKMLSDRFEGGAFVTAMSLLVAGFPVGVGLAGLLAGPFMAAWGWPAMFLAGAALAFASCVGLLLTCRGEAPGVAGWRLPSLRECRLVMVAGLIWTAYNAGYYGFLSYLPAYAAVRGHSPALVAAILAGATWLNLPFTLLGGSLAGRFGGTAVFAAGTAAFTLAVLGPALSDHLVLWGGLFGSLGAMHAGVIVAVGTLSARPENRATGMGLFYSTYYLGGAMLPALCGWAADRAGDASGAFVMAAALSALAVPAWILHRRMMRKTAV